MEQLRSLIKKLLQFRFVRFCITGGLNTLVDFIVFFLAHRSLKWPLIPSQVISYSAGILNSYCINRRWTFQTRNRLLRTGNAVVHRSKSLCAGSQRTVHVGVHHTDGLRDDPQQALHHCPDHGAGICTQPAAGFPQPAHSFKKQAARIQSRLFYYIIVCPLVKL